MDNEAFEEGMDEWLELYLQHNPEVAQAMQEQRPEAFERVKDDMLACLNKFFDQRRRSDRVASHLNGEDQCSN